MSLVYSGVMFHNELDMLELRLRELDSVVDYHVVVEARETHSGLPKALNYPTLERKLPQWITDKVIYITLDTLQDENGSRDAWQKEAYHRSQIAQGLVNCNPDDLVIISDCDEIVNPDVIPMIKDKAGLTLDLYYYRCTLKAREFWGIGAARWGVYNDVNGIRTNAMGGEQIDNAGWHLSYFGNREFIADKLKSFMHYDLAQQTNITQQSIQYAINTGSDLFRRADFILDDVPLGDMSHLPAVIQNNVGYYTELGWI